MLLKEILQHIVVQIEGNNGKPFNIQENYMQKKAKDKTKTRHLTPERDNDILWQQKEKRDANLPAIPLW